MDAHDYAGQPYETVVEEFKDLGFTNVTSEIVDNDRSADKEGTVIGVEVNGSSVIKGERSLSDAEIVVNYYGPYVPESDTSSSSNSSTQGSQSSSGSPSAGSSSSKVEWQTQTLRLKDAGGYEFDVTIKASPWISTNQTEILESAWSEVSDGDELPSESSWSLQEAGTNLYKYVPPSNRGTFIFPMTGMYYTVGTIEIKNVTDGWDITSDNPRDISLVLAWQSAFNNLSTTSYIVSKTFYSDGPYSDAGVIELSTSMHKNNLGPITFVAMAPQNITPDHPDGEYFADMAKGYFHLGGGNMSAGYEGGVPVNEAFNMHLGVIGYDGEYLPPDNDWFKS